MIDFKSVHKTYAKQVGVKAHTALSDVSFTVGSGETVGLVGANGAGKSTTLRILMGFLRPDKGILSVMGQNPVNHLVHRHIGYLPETASFPPNLTILDMLRFVGQTNLMESRQIQEASEKWLKSLELWEARKRPLRHYSKGMQQRANFVLALLNDPELLILDEPMSGLDPFGRADISNLIKDLKHARKTILFCSHILEDVDRLVDKVIVLHKGKNLFHGTIAELCLQQKSQDLVSSYLDIVQREARHEGFN